MAIGLLEVLLESAKGLANTDFLGRGGSWTWNERFTFRVEYPGSGGQYKLILKIMDKDTFTKDDFLGEATIYVEDLLAQGMENGTAELHSRKYSVVQADGTYFGEIQVGLSMTHKVEVETDRDFGGWKESDF